MEILDYLRQQERKLGKGISRIRNPKVFNFNYIPKRPLLRREMQPIIDSLLRYEMSSVPENMFIYGSRGSGKTLSVKYVRGFFQERGLPILYSNCRNHNTSFKILANLLGVRPRGIALEELWQKFTTTHEGRHVLVLDEVDLWSEKDPNRDLLYLLSRSSGNYMTILLSTNPKFLGLIDESTRSSLQLSFLHFRNYTPSEIQKILDERARIGLKKVSRGLLAKIAALTVRNTNSDVRVALKTLFYSVLDRQMQVEEHFERARRDILADLIGDVNDKNLLILRSAAEDSEKFVKGIYERYRRLSAEMKEPHYSYVHFYSNLSYLQSLGLILLISTKVGRAYTNRVQLLFSHEILDAVWQARFG